VPRTGEGQKLRTLLGGLIVTVFLCHAALFLGGMMDDAYISFRYARNLLDGLGLVFNAGERVEGFTNFSWLMLSALCLRAGIAPTLAMPLLGALAGALLVLVVFAAGRRLLEHEGEREATHRSDFAGAPAALMVALSTGIALYAVSGLEETFFALLTTCAALALIARRPVPFAGLTSLAFLTRPEAGVLGVVALWFALRDLKGARDRSARSELLCAMGKAALVFALVLIPYLTFKLWYFGSLVPNTLKAKEPDLALGLKYAAASLWPSALLLVVAGRAFLTGQLSTRRRELLLVWAAFVLGAVAAGGDWMPAARLYLPSLPLLLLAIDGLLVSDLYALKRAPRAAWPWVALLGLLLYAGASAAETHELAALVPQWELRNANSRKLARDYRRQGVRSIATVNIGALGYEAYDVTFLDLAGLVDAEIARGPGRHLHKQPSDAYLIGRDPQLYILASLKPILPDAAGNAQYVPVLEIERYVFSRPWFMRRYHYAGTAQLLEGSYYHLFAKNPSSARQ
jgi:arabinofuranosyltransferase